MGTVAVSVSNLLLGCLRSCRGPACHSHTCHSHNDADGKCSQADTLKAERWHPILGGTVGFWGHSQGFPSVILGLQIFYERRPFFFFFYFLGPHLWHMDVPRLGVESELHLQAYTTATATSDPSHVFNLCSTLQ